MYLYLYIILFIVILLAVYNNEIYYYINDVIKVEDVEISWEWSYTSN